MKTYSTCCMESFTEVERVHSYNTRQKQSHELFLPKVKKNQSSYTRISSNQAEWGEMRYDAKVLS